jgi:hypothetical protein
MSHVLAHNPALIFVQALKAEILANRLQAEQVLANRDRLSQRANTNEKYQRK